MSPDICLLISLSNGCYLLKIALKLDKNKLKDEAYLEADNKHILRSLFPDGLALSDFNIVHVEEIFEITTA